MSIAVDPDRLRRCYAVVRDLLLGERTPAGHWVGELSTSALSTATAVMALLQVRRAFGTAADLGSQSAISPAALERSIWGGLKWLVAHQNADGGWGDTLKSFSNISTTMLCHAVLVAVGRESACWGDVEHPRSVDFLIRAAQGYIDRAGGVSALKKRYGKDKTFSIPILTHCALAGLVDWKEITPLPFELACVPARFYKTVRLPVVSYALPALIAIGQVRHHFAPTWNPITRVLRNLAKQQSLAILERIQPPNGGFLEATPLTSFVTMSLAAMGLVNHPVVQKGVEFIVNSVRPDGSWPIDTNLATWVTTLSVNALGDDLPEESRLPILNWLLDQQYQEVHPYTNADPGSWAWTNLPGGVPDADDTAGAMLAAMELGRLDVRGEMSEVRGQRSEVRSRPSNDGSSSPRSQAPAWERTRHEAPLRGSPEDLECSVFRAASKGTMWLVRLQNRDGGFPTFCRGWGTLPFDRSSPDITAHAIRALHRLVLLQNWSWNRQLGPHSNPDEDALAANFRPLRKVNRGRLRGFAFLESTQLPDGSWLPLWFGNQHVSEDANPTYGTAKVLAAYRDCWLLEHEPARRGLAWLRSNQNPDGGWGAGPGTPSSVEETSLAVEALLDDPQAEAHVARGLNWLMEKVEAVVPSSQAAPQQPGCWPPGSPPRDITDPAPIGFYFAKLWYFERLYPLIFAVSCLRRAAAKFTTVAGDMHPRNLT